MPALGALALVGAVGSIYGGIAANSAAQSEAALQRQQGDIAVAEAKTNAQNEAYNQTQAVQRQRLAFLGNGVSLEGSPALVLAKSKEYGQSQVDAILTQGANRQSLAYGEAAITANKGRTALIGGLLQAGSKGYSSGLFDGAGSGATGGGMSAIDELVGDMAGGE